MPPLDDALASLAALEELLRLELAHAEREAEALRTLDAEALLDAPRSLPRREEVLLGQIEATRAALKRACVALGAPADTLDSLSEVDAPTADLLRRALDTCRSMGQRIAQIRHRNSDVASRVLRLVRALERQHPLAPGTYGRGGRASCLPTGSTTSRHA